MKTAGMNFPPHGVLIVWKWEWTAVEESESEEEDDSHEQHNPHLHSDSEHSDSETETNSPDIRPPPTHTVTFKCIGPVHDTNAQALLIRVSQILRGGGGVDVHVSPEPDNPYDSQAIAFQCHIDRKWQRIGYVVRECLSHVHEAIQEKRLLSVKFSWAKYLACWARSGPGFYAGIDLTVSGNWHRDVIKSQSTK